MKPAHELAEIIRFYGEEFNDKHHPLKQHQRVLNALSKCRTSSLGGHVDSCTDCGYERISYNSCRNRHCPKCQSINRERWIEAREKDLLDTTYFHVVFTLPSEFNTYCHKYPVEMYNNLFQSSRETMFQFGYDPKHLGAELGIISILHTWGQTLQLHPHVHMIVPGGGITKAGKWKACKSKGKFLFPVEALSKVFKGKFMEQFKLFLSKKQLHEDVSERRILYNKNWVVYAKEPFLGSKQVIEYLGRYTHKIAISNHRLLSVENHNVHFKYKDYKQGNITQIMPLDALEFLRRFCLHILPPKFVKIRHYGILSNRGKEKLRSEQISMGIKIDAVTKKDYKEIAKTKLNFDIEQCPCCKTGRMICILTFSANAPPVRLSNKYSNTNFDKQ